MDKKIYRRVLNIKKPLSGNSIKCSYSLRAINSRFYHCKFSRGSKPNSYLLCYRIVEDGSALPREVSRRRANSRQNEIYVRTLCLYEQLSRGSRDEATQRSFPFGFTQLWGCNEQNIDISSDFTLVDDLSRCGVQS